MKGLVIWAYSECRSTMATYRALAIEFGVQTKIIVLHGRPGCGVDLRVKTGFRSDEFANVNKIYLEMNVERGKSILNETRGWNHLFCDYQGSALVRKLIHQAKRDGGRIGIMTEAPCNMLTGKRRLLKNIFMHTVLPLKARAVVRQADFFVNYSGSDSEAHNIVRWPKNKIIPFGYFPPPIEGSHSVLRTTCKPFHILATGILSRYRGADVLVEALRLLKMRGIEYRATITQDGELLSELKEMAMRYDLPIDFPGFVAMPDLIRLYETCSVYVGAGRNEPWGMRLNDALNCGAPLVVSSGMGGHKLVDDYGCGLVFRRNDANSLAEVLCRLLEDDQMFTDIAQRVYKARSLISPESMAVKLHNEISKKVGWA